MRECPTMTQSFSSHTFNVTFLRLLLQCATAIFRYTSDSDWRGELLEASIAHPANRHTRAFEVLLAVVVRLMLNTLPKPHTRLRECLSSIHSSM